MKKNHPLSHRQQQLRNLWYIFQRNVFLLTNGVIAAVVALLFLFGDTQASVFLGLVLIINVSLGLAQDIRAWWALQQLQLLTAPRITRVLPDGNTEIILTEAIQKHDHLQLKIGDQVPADGTLLEAQVLELNEGLITGESTSLPRKTGDKILAGSIITAGSAVMRADTIFQESRIARMTEGLQSYGGNVSPIQREVGRVIRYAGYFLIVAIVFVVVRGFIVHESQLIVIKNIGALASSLVPQGLIFALTLLFAYGAAHLYRRNVLLQEINATEKLGRIKNLCMDKTGTLTENVLAVEKVELHPDITLDEVKRLLVAYTQGSSDTSQTMTALRAYVGATSTSDEVRAAYPFSSWRSYGTVEIVRPDEPAILIAVGAPEHLLAHFHDATERARCEQFTEHEARQGKRVLCVARIHGNALPTDLTEASLSLVALFTLSSRLRPGIREAIDFFQKRGVHIRIISGDHPETVRSVAREAGVQGCEHIITGREMLDFTETDYLAQAKKYTIFARIVPEQKEKIIAALKQDGFTAMVGDGANDALAIKTADLGIAMFEGAPATRELASVVLTNNSFTALPGGVELADSIIKNAEIFASLFLGAALVDAVLFLGVSLFGYPFPLTPLNITLINYFTVGFPGILVSYWTLWPTKQTIAPSTPGFLRKVAPFMVASALIQGLALVILFLFSAPAMKQTTSNIWVLLGSIVVGYVFFLFAPHVYRGLLSWTQRRDLLILTTIELLFLFLIFRIPLLVQFFEIQGEMTALDTSWPLSLLLVFGVLQYLLARFALQNKELPQETQVL